MSGVTLVRKGKLKVGKSQYHTNTLIMLAGNVTRQSYCFISWKRKNNVQGEKKTDLREQVHEGRKFYCQKLCSIMRTRYLWWKLEIWAKEGHISQRVEDVHKQVGLFWLRELSRKYLSQWKTSIINTAVFLFICFWFDALHLSFNAFCNSDLSILYCEVKPNVEE